MRHRRHPGAVIAATALTCTALAPLVLASPASAAGWHCESSYKSLDMPQYDGPFSDNFDFTVKACAARSGSVVYGYTKISWDGPNLSSTAVPIFDSARFRVYLKRSVIGADDPIKLRADTGMTAALEHVDSWGTHDGSKTTETINYRMGSSAAIADGALFVDWNNDGRGERPMYKFAASPRV